MKPCPKSQRCSPGGRWKLHLALIDLDEQGIDARIADIQTKNIYADIGRAVFGHIVGPAPKDIVFKAYDGNRKIWV